jgi:cyclase
MSSGLEHAHEITTPGRPQTVEVADGVYAYIQPDGTWWINNTGFVTGPQGVFSIDACSTERRTRAYLAAIRKVSTAPVRTVVNTHHHGDHTFGNALFSGATIVAHERARAEVIAFGPARELPFWENPDWGHLPLEPPFLTFTDEIALHAGDTRITVKHVGTPAHTTNDVVAWFPEQSVLFCGDLVFNGGTPFLLMGSVAGAVDALEQAVLPLGARTIVPGHGPVFEGTAPVEATLDYLRFVLDLAARGQAAGVSPLEAARATDLGRFADWPDAERIVGNLHRAYAELAGTTRGGPIDVMEALADMVTYNRGKPLTCLALSVPYDSVWSSSTCGWPPPARPGSSSRIGWPKVTMKEVIGAQHRESACFSPWRALVTEHAGDNANAPGQDGSCLQVAALTDREATLTEFEIVHLRVPRAGGLRSARNKA